MIEKNKKGNRINSGDQPDWDMDSTIEMVWSDLHGRVDRQTIRFEIASVIPSYEDATIKNFIPLFIYREVIKRLSDGFQGD